MGSVLLLRSKVPWVGWHSLALGKVVVEVKGRKISLCKTAVLLLGKEAIKKAGEFTAVTQMAKQI